MDGLISRRKAINTADAMRKVCDTGRLDDYHALMVGALEALPTARRWIPVTESVPETDDTVLAVFDSHDDLVYACAWHDGKEWKCWDDCVYTFDEVIAWMPIDPYEVKT